MVFVAREQEILTLRGTLDRACNGDGGVVIIVGEPGSGKTVLLRRVVDYAEEHVDRPRIILARCYTSDVADPYAPWRQLTATYPALEHRLPQPIGGAEPAVQGIAELGRRVTEALIDAAADSPMVVAFEDIDLADDSSLVLLRALAQRAASTALLLVLTVNAAQTNASRLAGWLNTLVSESRVTLLEMTPISPEEISRHIDEIASSRSPAVRQRISETLVRLSGGNLLVLNSLLDVFETGVIDLVSDDDIAERLPTSFGGVIAALVGRLPSSTTDILGLAAIAGETIDLDMLAELRSIAPVDLAGRLDAALAVGLLVEDIDGTVRFRHGVLQQMLARHQPALQRRLAHANILDWLRHQPDSRAGEIARHAERSGDLTTAYHALLDAAHQARDEFGFPEAAKLYMKALSIAERLHIPDAEQDSVRLAMADVLVWNDRVRGTREIDRVTTRAGLRGDALMLARSAQRRATMLYEDGDVSGCLTILTEAIPILRAEGDTESLATALTYTGYCHGSGGRYDDLEDIAEELLELARQTGTPMYQAVALQFLASLRVGRGEGGDALGLVLQCVDIAEELGHVDHATDYAAVGIVTGVVAHLHEPARMRALLQRGEELARLRSLRLVVSDTPEPAFVSVRFLYGDWDVVRSAVPILETLVDSSPKVVRDMTALLVAELALAEGRRAACELALDRVARTASDGIGDHASRTWMAAASRRVQLCLATRDIAGAAEWVNAMDRVLAEREFAPGRLALDIARGRLALARGDTTTARTIAVDARDKAHATHHQLAFIQSCLLEAEALRIANYHDEAARLATMAIERACDCQLPYEGAEARIERARALLASGDAVAAHEDLARAGAIFARLGATAGIREIESLTPRIRATRPAGVTAREIEVLRLVAQGLSDRQIADQLFISHRTVTTHVGNLLGKTQSANRTELAIWALRHDIVGSTDEGVMV